MAGPARAAVGHVGLIGALRRMTAAGGVEPPASFIGRRGVSFADVSEHRSATNSKAAEDPEGIWARNERIRLAELRADGERPMGVLLEEGVELSRFASEFAATARSER